MHRRQASLRELSGHESFLSDSLPDRRRWHRCVVERPQNVGYPSRILHAEPASVPGCEEPFERLVPERADHMQSVRRWLTIVKQCLTIIRSDTRLRRNTVVPKGGCQDIARDCGNAVLEVPSSTPGK